MLLLPIFLWHYLCINDDILYAFCLRLPCLSTVFHPLSVTLCLVVKICISEYTIASNSWNSVEPVCIHQIVSIWNFSCVKLIFPINKKKCWTCSAHVLQSSPCWTGPAHGRAPTALDVWWLILAPYTYEFMNHLTGVCVWPRSQTVQWQWWRRRSRTQSGFVNKAYA